MGLLSTCVLGGGLVWLALALLVAVWYRIWSKKPRATGIPLAKGYRPLVGHLSRLKEMRQSGMESHHIFFEVGESPGLSFVRGLAHVFTA